MRSPLVWVAALATAAPLVCVADSPVLDYSLKFGGSGRHEVLAAAVDRDGSVYIAGITNSTDFPTTQQAPYARSEYFSVLLPYLFVTRLSPDGTSIMCSVVVGGGYNDILSAMALGPDGTVYLLGSTASSNFPITTGSAPSDYSRFLMRLNPCDGKILLSTMLLSSRSTIVGGLAVDRDGNAAVTFTSIDGTFPAGITPIEPAGTGIVLLVDPNGKRLASAKVPGEVRSVAIGADGAVYVAGREITSKFFYNLFVAKLDPKLQSAAYIRRISGDNAGSIFASAVAIDEVGNAYVTGGATIASNFPVTADAAFTSRSNGGILLKLNPLGVVLYATHTEAPDNIPRAASSGVGIAPDPNGKVYVATAGTYGLPEIGPSSDRAPFSGVRIRVFAPDGSVEDGDLLVPSGQYFGFGFDGERHVVVATAHSAVPVTQDSLSASVPEPLSVVKVDYGASQAPRLESDVDTLTFTIFYSGPSQLADATKVANLSTSTGSSVPVSIAILSEGGPGRQSFSAPEQVITPAAIAITATGGFSSTATAVFAAPGLRAGLRVVPLRMEPSNIMLRTRLDGSLNAAAPSTQPLTASLHVSAASYTRFGVIEVGVHYQVETATPWLRVDNQAGVTPADLALTADPSGLSSGVYQASLIIQGPTQVLGVNVTLTIGPVFRLSGAPVSVTLPANSPPVTYPLRLTSSSSELDFQVQPLPDWLEMTPTSGRTPADLVLTLNPAKLTPAISFGMFSLVSTTGSQIMVFFRVALAQPAPPQNFPLAIAGGLAPGGLIHVQGLGVSCADATATLPWPTELGGCSVRLNGVTLPIGATISGTASAGFGVLPIVDVLSQVPYDLSGLTGRIEISALNGVVRTTPLYSDPFVATSPQLLYNGPPAFAPPWLTRADGSLSSLSNPVRTGEVVSFRISGYGRTEPAAPLGDVPNAETTMRPVARMDAFIDGRKAEVVSAELSKTEVGVAEVRVRIPEIQPDDHLFILRVGTGETYPAPLRIVP